MKGSLLLAIVRFFQGSARHIFPKYIAFIACGLSCILDSIISLASKVCAQAISYSADEARATSSTGVSVNRLITIFIALFGGWIWKALGIETPFILSSAPESGNSACAATIKVKQRG